MDRPPDPPSQASLLDGQMRKNAASRGLWREFGEHRRRVTDLLLAAAATTDQPRLVVLGAGNCNDLDLARLRGRFASIQLVDCDAQAVMQGVARQGLAGDSAIRCVAPVDLAAAAPNPRFTSPAHVAASVCLLSQILDDVATTAGTDHPRYADTVRDVRRAHLQLLIDLLLPGGTGLFVTDLVSSDSAPQLASATPLTLPRLLQELVASGNFFSGLNPAVVHSLLTTDEVLAARIENVTVSQPWLWNFGQRIYAVYAVQFRRAG